MEKRIRIFLRISLVSPLVFALMILWYVASPWYLGPMPAGILMGVCILAEICALVFSVIHLFRFGESWESSLTIIVSLLSGLGMGCFFYLWLLLMLTPVS